MFAVSLLAVLPTLAPEAASAPQSGVPQASPRAGRTFAPTEGRWETPVNHDSMPMPHLNALHAALIPEGPHRGKILVWNDNHGGTGSTFLQTWGLADFTIPGAPTFTTEQLVMPANEGDLFCAGFSWTPDGKLFVAGGTLRGSADWPDLPWR
jgi:hypothetical protein